VSLLAAADAFEERQSTRQTAELKKARDAAVRDAERLQAKVDELQHTLNVVESAEGARLTPPKWLAKPKSKTGHRATLALLLSDTHFDEVVEPGEIHGLNAYSRRIAELRLEAWAQNAVKIARHHLAGVDFDGVVLMLGGDMFSGDIHEELQQTNADSILGSLLHWSERLAAAIDLLSDSFGAVHVPVVPGNHGRTSRKPRAKLRARTNYDWLLAKMLERHYQADKRVTFAIGDSADVQFDVYGHGQLLTHGDQTRGGGGIGGIYPPIMRMRARKAQRAMAIGRPFETLWMGHWHQLLTTPNLVVNGSLKGYDEYAAISNFEYEPARQALALITPEHGITVQCPVFCVDRKKERW
jgi:hypothetical protein